MLNIFITRILHIIVGTRDSNPRLQAQNLTLLAAPTTTTPQGKALLYIQTISHLQYSARYGTRLAGKLQ